MEANVWFSESNVQLKKTSNPKTNITWHNNNKLRFLFLVDQSVVLCSNYNTCKNLFSLFTPKKLTFSFPHSWDSLLNSCSYLFIIHSRFVFLLFLFFFQCFFLSISFIVFSAIFLTYRNELGFENGDSICFFFQNLFIKFCIRYWIKLNSKISFFII